MKTERHRVLLDLAAGDGDDPPHEDLSSVVAAGDDLWLASDEGARLERLTRSSDGSFGGHASFPLRQFVRLPEDEEEVDVEGLDVDAGWLWVVGSHSVRRRKPDDEASVAKRLRRLTRLDRSRNRDLLARIPLIRTLDGGSEPVPRVVDDAAPGGVREAGQLRIGKRRGALARAVADDPHLAPSLGVPGKENGFDVEGLAARGDRVWVGLRGPVLRGWAVVLELEVRADEDDPSRLRLRRIGRGGRRYRKHLLDLCGLGVRELCLDGGDLLLLAGPTMTLDGRSAVFRWRDALRTDDDELVERDRLDVAIELPYGVGEDEGVDHPEGMTLSRMPDGRPALLVVYDAPHASRRRGRGGVEADLFPLG